MAIPCQVSNLYNIKISNQRRCLNIIGYIYKTTNLINKKIYIGKHESKSYDNKYLGSGKVLKLAIKKYGIKYFKNEIIEICNTIEELNKKEKYYISIYKDNMKKNCYNIANGGDGGNTLMYKTQKEIDIFRKKMAVINKNRSNSLENRQKMSIITTNRYKNKDILLNYKNKLKEIWKDEELRKKHSKLLKNYYSKIERDCSFNNQKCVFEKNNKVIIFKSVKDLRNYLISEHNYNPDRRTFKKLLEQGKNRIPYTPFHKNNFKLMKLKGMLLYKLEKDVETKGDEFSPVG